MISCQESGISPPSELTDLIRFVLPKIWLVIYSVHFWLPATGRACRSGCLQVAQRCCCKSEVPCKQQRTMPSHGICMMESQCEGFCILSECLLQEAAIEESKQAEAAKERMQTLSAAREEQLDALKARLLAERCACPSHDLHQRIHLISMMMCSMLSFLYMFDSNAALPRGPRPGRMIG